jgi:small subunit ribosomal protein S7
MPRIRFKKREIGPDPLYQSPMVEKMVNLVMRKGKKILARKMVYKALEKIKGETKRDPLKVLEEAVKNSMPELEVRATRIGGAIYQVPVRVKGDRGMRLALRWLVQGAKEKKGKPFFERLAEEIILSSKKQGWAFKKKEDLHKIAQANKAFAHFAW